MTQWAFLTTTLIIERRTAMYRSLPRYINDSDLDNHQNHTCDNLDNQHTPVGVDDDDDDLELNTI